MPYFWSSVHPQNINAHQYAKCSCESATEPWQDNLESLFDKPLSLFIPYPSAFNSFLPVAVSDVLFFLSRVLPRESCSSLGSLHTCVQFYCGCYSPRAGAGAGIMAAPLSPAFQRAIRECVLVLLLHAEGDPGLGCCLTGTVDKTFGPSIPNV